MSNDQYNCTKCRTIHKSPSKIYHDHKKYEGVPSVAQGPLTFVAEPPAGEQPVAPPVKGMIGVAILMDGDKMIPAPFLKGDITIGEALGMLKQLENYIMTRKMEGGTDGA